MRAVPAAHSTRRLQARARSHPQLVMQPSLPQCHPQMSSPAACMMRLQRMVAKQIVWTNDKALRMLGDARSFPSHRCTQGTLPGPGVQQWSSAEQETSTTRHTVLMAVQGRVPPQHRQHVCIVIRQQRRAQASGDAADQAEACPQLQCAAAACCPPRVGCKIAGKQRRCGPQDLTCRATRLRSVHWFPDANVA